MTSSANTDATGIQASGTTPESSDSARDTGKQVMEWRPPCAVDEMKHGSTIYLPANFPRPNTNLNLPPANWLRSGSKIERYIRDYRLGWNNEHSEFSRMATSFLDVIGTVDVVSDAENIKKLLKIPNNKSHVSMMVHRVRKTLLLDNFDIHKHLLRQQQEDWEWMRKFYRETVVRNMEEKMKCVPKKNKSRDYLQNRNLYSKFLYYSVAELDEKSSLSMDGGITDMAEDSSLTDRDIALQPSHDSLLKPHDSEFHREVLWTFEDIQMLIGTDLPIFRAGPHPCISVRLREMSKPVNVLTGMDYWLDNLMCNVPELAMCFHLNGIVQKYELIQTADIPDLDNSKFSPQEVMDIAKNILSFLKANATKEGHTYWLYKGVDDDVVKLYDLTMLCSDELGESSENPFTVPLGMLLYRVARNMREQSGRKHVPTIRTLLNTCIMLLDPEKHAQVYTSANYWLADLYVPDSVVTNVWTLSANNEESDSELDDTEQEEDNLPEMSSKSVKVQALSDPEQSFSEKKPNAVVKYSSFVGTAEDKCWECLKCIRLGLNCLNDSATAASSSSSSSSGHEETQAKCNPDEAIPLFYEPLHPPKSSSSGSKSANQPCNSRDLSLSPPHSAVGARASISRLHFSSPSMSSSEKWHLLLKVLLYRKAAMSYYCLATIAMDSEKYGAALKYSRLALCCFTAMKQMSNLKGDDNRELLCVINGVIADSRLMVARHVGDMEALRQDYLSLSDLDTQLADIAQSDIATFENEWMCTLTDSIETNLTCCCVCYEEAMQLTLSKDKILSLSKRLGNARNELGVLYMNKARCAITAQSGDQSLEDLEAIWKLSYSCLDSGVSVFESIGDTPNQALLLSNIGQLMRICAQTHVEASTAEKAKREFTDSERHYYTKAVIFYQKALTALSHRSNYPQIWDSVSWQLSTTYFNMAMLLQDYAPLSIFSKEEVEREIVDLMNKSLKHCDVDKSSPRAVTYQYRAATINHRLASLHHHSYRDQPNTDQRKKHLRQLANNHYERAANYYHLTESHSDLLRVHLEQVAMCEFHLEESSSAGSHMKILEAILGHLITCQSALTGLHQLCKEAEMKTEPSMEREEAERLLDIFKSRLLRILLAMTKHYSKSKKSRDEENDKAHLSRKIYGLALQTMAGDDKPVLQKCETSVQVLSLIDQLWSGAG